MIFLMPEETLCCQSYPWRPVLLYGKNVVPVLNSIWVNGNWSCETLRWIPFSFLSQNSLHFRLRLEFDVWSIHSLNKEECATKTYRVARLLHTPLSGPTSHAIIITPTKRVSISRLYSVALPALLVAVHSQHQRKRLLCISDRWLHKICMYIKNTFKKNVDKEPAHTVLSLNQRCSLSPHTLAETC